MYLFWSVYVDPDMHALQATFFVARRDHLPRLPPHTLVPTASGAGFTSRLPRDSPTSQELSRRHVSAASFLRVCLWDCIYYAEDFAWRNYSAVRTPFTLGCTYTIVCLTLYPRVRCTRKLLFSLRGSDSFYMVMECAPQAKT